MADTEPAPRKPKPPKVPARAGSRPPSGSEPPSEASSGASPPPGGASSELGVGSESEASSSKPSLKAFVRDLGKGSEAEREAAAQKIGSLGPRARKAVPYLAKSLLNDDSEAVRIRCAKTLGQLGGDALKGIPALLRTLSEGKKDRSRNTKSVSGAAAKALKKIGPPAVPHLLAALEVEGLRRRAARLLKAIEPDEGAEARAAFQEVLDGDDGRASLLAVECLEEHGVAAIPYLLLATADPNDDVSKRGLLALRALGKDAVGPLARSLGDTSPRVRASAARALGSIAKHVSQRAVSRVLHRLLETLEDSDPLVRTSAVQALGNLRDHEERVLPPLVKTLGDKDSTVSLQAVMAILNVGEDKDELVTRMTDVLRGSRNTYTRVGSCMVLMHMGADAKAAVPALVEALEDAASEVREYAHLALQSIRTPSMRLNVIRTASMRLKVVDEEETKKKAPRKKAKRKPGTRRRTGRRR